MTFATDARTASLCAADARDIADPLGAAHAAAAALALYVRWAALDDPYGAEEGMLAVAKACEAAAQAIREDVLV